MSVEASTWAWKQKLPCTDKLVLLALADHCCNEGACWPSTGSIVKKTGLSRRQVFYSLEALRNAGLLTIQKRKADTGDYCSNLYVLTITKPQKEPEGGSAHRALGVVHTVHGGSARGAPKSSIEPSSQKEAPPVGAVGEDTSSLREFTISWCQRWNEINGGKYMHQGAKDAQAIKRLLTTGIPVHVLIDTAVKAWRLTEKHDFERKMSMDISSFVSQFNKIRAAVEFKPRRAEYPI